MKTNHTIKNAVISALTILALGAQTQALALGLGNIDIKSHLGQPLRASIKIEGAGELKDASCFRVLTDSSVENQLTHANFKLSNIVNDVAILTVTTNNVINEPIVNLSIMAECDANMQRDYVLLLDPPLAADEAISDEASTGVVEEQAKPKAASKKAKRAAVEPFYPQTIRVGEPTSVAPSEKASKKHKKGSKTNEVVSSTGYKRDETPDIKAASNVANTSKPRLTISGGDAANIDLKSAQLQLDKQLHFTPETAPLQPGSQIELDDEATVMRHRLAHLEKQISALSLSNQKLNTENNLNKQELAEANSWNNKFSWIGYIIGGALVFGSVTIADKWRRRRQDEQLEIAQLEWERNAATSHNKDAEETDATLTAINVEEANDEFFASEAPTQPVENAAENLEEIEFDKAPVVPFAVEEFNADQNVLDHADVFLSHGRTTLAIQLLQNHLLDFPKHSVTIWLFLLDLLAKENLESAYNQTSLECKQHFNIKIAEFSQLENIDSESLESFPRISAGLEQVWGTPAALTYLDDLIYNSRLEERVGFHRNIIEELLTLKSVAQEELKTAEVIQLDEKKLELMELKEAQLALKKEEKIKQMEEMAFAEAERKVALQNEIPYERFEFSLVDYKS